MGLSAPGHLSDHWADYTVKCPPLVHCRAEHTLQLGQMVSEMLSNAPHCGNGAIDAKQIH